MEFQEFIVYTFLSLLGVLIILGILNLIYNTRIVKRFSGKFVKVIANYELQSEDLSSLFTVTFFNNNMADIKVHSFGLMYCNEQVDFYEEYVKANLPEIKTRMLIEPSDSVKLEVPYERMKKMLLAIKNNHSKVFLIYGFIVDSNGNQTIVKLKDVRKNVKRIFKSELQEEDLERKEEIRKATQAKKEALAKQTAEQKELKRLKKEEQKELRKKKREERRQKRSENWKIRKENWNKFWQNLMHKVKRTDKKNAKSEKKESD